MKQLLLKAAVATAALFVFVSSCLAYTYFLTENLYAPNLSNWTVAGTIAPAWYNTGNYGGIGDGSQGTMLSNYALSSDVSVTVRGTANTFYLYLDYSSFWLGSSQVQTYYGVNIAGNGGTIGLYKQYINSYQNPTFVYLTGTGASFGDNSIVRVVTRPDGAISGATDVIIYVNNALVMWYQDSPRTLARAGKLSWPLTALVTAATC